MFPSLYIVPGMEKLILEREAKHSLQTEINFYHDSIGMKESWPKSTIIRSIEQEPHVDFQVPTRWLLKYSRFFAEELPKDKCWLKSHGVFQFTHLHTESFAVFVHFLKGHLLQDTNSLLPKADTQLISQPKEEHEEWMGKNNMLFKDIPNKRLDQLIYCHAMGNQVGAPEFQNIIMTALIQEYRDFYTINDSVPLYHVHMIFELTQANDPLRRVIVDLIHFGMAMRPMKIGADYLDFPKEFLLMAEETDNTSLGRENSAPWLKNSCQYHEHPDDRFNKPCAFRYSESKARETVKASFQERHPELYARGLRQAWEKQR